MALSKRKQKISDSLGSMVKSRFSVAQQANQEPHQRCLECLRLLDGKVDTQDDDDHDEAEEFRVAMNITGPLVRGIHALLAEILDPILAQPFVLKPTPVVTLPDDVTADLRQAITDNIEQLITMTGGNDQQFANIINEMVATTIAYYNEDAETRANNLTPIISDRLVDGGFSEEFSDWLLNFVSYPLAILKGPVSELDKVKVWHGTMMGYETQLIRKVRNISPFDIFPAPHARDLNSCEYLIERQRLDSSQLLDLIGAPGYDSDGIASVLEDYERYIIDYMTGNGNGDGSAPDSDPETSGVLEYNDGYYDTLIYYGKIRGRDLVEFGVEVEDDRRFYEAEIWVVDQTVIKAVLNPDELERRPFYATNFYSTPGKLWGKSIVEIVRDAQIQCTAAGRALVRNMGFASGPMGEVDTQRVTGEDDPTLIYPMMMKPTKGSSISNNPAYKFWTVPSLAQELLGVYDKFSAIAYELIGIPRMAFGQTQGASTIGRTSGGVAMVMNQASKPIKQAMKRAEKKVIEPIIQRFTDFELMYNPDESLKGDVNVRASGVEGLQEKEAQEGKLEWALQTIAPFAQNVQIPPEYFMRLFEKLLEHNGISTKGLPNFALQDAVSQDMASAQGGIAPETPAQPGGANPTAFLDGRSATAISTIGNMNNMSGLQNG